MKDTVAIDPRVLRSRRMLMEALARLLGRKSLDDISIQDIADEATLNRATFYLHYPDKNSLLQSMAAARFRELTERRGLSFTNCDGALQSLVLGVCDYLAQAPGCPANMPVEGAIIPVVEGIFREGPPGESSLPGVERDLLATTAAWAIFGAARLWMATPDRLPAEEIAEKIAAVVKPIFHSVTAQATLQPAPPPEAPAA